MRIQLEFNVPSIADKTDAEDWAVSLSEHVVDTFNDDGSLDPLVGIRVIEEYKEV